MNDETLIQRIGALVEEEHALERALAQDPEGTPEADDRLRELEVALDQCWDLLRQRRALEEYGLDAHAARVRPAETIERYDQ